MNKTIALHFLIVLALCLGTVATVEAQRAFDADAMVAHVRYLSSDSLEGRRTGSRGAEKARTYIQAMYQRHQLQPFGETYAEVFLYSPNGLDSLRGVNMLGFLPGTEDPETFIVLTAHYDHLGIQGGEVFNGADDNASGVAGLLAAADYFSEHPLRHSLLFAALDAEESGLRGAHGLIQQPPVARERLALNVNLDMISRNERHEIFIAGTHHYPTLKPFLDRVAKESDVQVRYGHDQPGGAAGQDWTLSSDHGPFHQVGIPFVYFGVEDHPDYHKATDEFENIDPEFLTQAVETILRSIEALDAHLEDIARMQH